MNRSKALQAALRAILAGVGLYLLIADAVAAPSLWIVKSRTATVYLFGTIHLLRASADWETPAFRRALAESQELWLEVPDFENADAARQLVTQLGFDSNHPLSTLLSPNDLARLRKAATLLGLPQGEATLEPMRPWLAALTLANVHLLHAGYDPGAGVEHVLLDQWNARHKQVRGFETLDEQLHFFADLAPQLQEEVLENTLSEFDQGVAKLNAIVAAWMRGDQKAITRLMVDELRQPFPDLYRTIIVERNERWTETIDGMLKQPGKRFIAVGAGHLAGPDSVLAKLFAKGFEARLVR